MQQSALWHDVLTDAIGSAVQAAGGTKRVASKLWPTLDTTSATARLRSALNPDQPQKLDGSEILAIARFAKDAGDHSVMNFLARELGYEIQPLAPEESKKRARSALRLSLLEQLRRLEDEE